MGKWIDASDYNINPNWDDTPDPDFELMMVNEIVEYNIYQMNVTDLQYWAKRALMDKWSGAPSRMVEAEYNSLLGLKEKE